MTYDIDDLKMSSLIKNLKSICGHDEKRIRRNVSSLEKKNHCFKQNALKDIVRNKFKFDMSLPSHERGVHHGRKRIAHCPGTVIGAADILNFLSNFKKEEIDNE